MVIAIVNNRSGPIRDLCPSEADRTRGRAEISKPNAGRVRTEDGVYVLEERVANNPGWVRATLARDG